MKGWILHCGVCLIRWIVLGTVLLAAGLSASGCASDPALQKVAAQNEANARAYAANIDVLTDAARRLAEAQTGAILRRAREQVAQNLIRLRATITPSDPTDTELLDPGSPWHKAVSTEVSALTTRIAAAPIEQRSSIAESLAETHPATIDLAIGTPGFSQARVLQNALALDRLNEMIGQEPNAGVRAGMLAGRDALLDPYLPARAAADASRKFLAAVDQFIAAVDDQGRILGLHAGAMRGFAAGPTPNGTAIAVFQSQDLRAAALDLVTRAFGPRAADDLRDRLRRADEAIGAVTAAANR